jgi:outer membrane protein OmpA-like peptidoglycan-associated protein
VKDENACRGAAVKLRFVSFLLLFVFVLAGGAILAQNEPTSASGNSGMNMVAQTTRAVNYRRGESTNVDMKGTNLMPELTGKAKVISKRGLTDVHVDVEQLRPAKSIDLAYVTFVLWAISPQGNPKNIGELVNKDGKASLHTTTDLQAFALVITAEPDFAVSAPSELVVAQNSVRPDTKGGTETVEVRYEVFPRSAYISQVEPVEKSIYGADKKAPLDLIQARNAVRVARDAHADEYAPEIFQRAQTLLNQAEDYYRRKQGDKPISTVARHAVQTAEEARVMSLKAEQQARIERERRETERRTEEAQSQAQQAQQQAQEAREKGEADARQRAAAEQQSQQAAQQAEQAQQQAQQQAEQARQQAEQARQQAEQAQQQTQAEAQQRAAAEQQSHQAAAQAEEARILAEQAQRRAQQAETDQAQIRQRLMGQLNAVLQTRDSARGLIVSMPDVLFDTGSANLKPTARERLAKVAGILIAYPDTRVEVDGYTDSTGSALFNEQLSQQRADSVRSFMNQQGVSPSSITTRGLGQSNPIASNETSTGRQQNRRVELVVSGESIGSTQVSTQ